MERKWMACCMLFVFIAGNVLAKDNTLSRKEKRQGWILLFDGKTLNGWKNWNKDLPVSGWSVENGCLSTQGGGGDIVTLEDYGNFEFSFEWKIEENKNSGVMYHVKEGEQYCCPYMTGPEFQVFGDAHSPNRTKNSTASNYDMHIPAADMKLNPNGTWNQATIIYKNGKVEHWVNGKKVIAFDEWSDDYKARYKASKWNSAPDYAKFKTGKISLQDHGDPVQYKNLKIRKL